MLNETNNIVTNLLNNANKGGPTNPDKYGYNNVEKFLMVIITVITNFCYIPSIYIFYLRKMYYHVFIGILTMVSSFMYHLLDSLGIWLFFMNVGEWHRLDNVGSISGERNN